MTFIEPMITLESLQKREATSAPVPAPARSSRAIPARYTVTWDANTAEHSLAIEDLAKISMR